MRNKRAKGGFCSCASGGCCRSQVALGSSIRADDKDSKIGKEVLRCIEMNRRRVNEMDILFTLEYHRRLRLRFKKGNYVYSHGNHKAEYAESLNVTGRLMRLDGH